MLKFNLLRFVHDALSPQLKALSNARLQASYDLNRGPVMAVETAATDAELDVMWAHIAEAWTGLGSSEPLWSVLSARRYLAKSRPSPEEIDSFYDSGRGDRDYLFSFLKRAGLADKHFPVVAEYGCGVGRVTRWLAGDFDHIRAIDISASHLAMARAHLDRSEIANVSLHTLKGREGLSHLAGADLFFSIIVLQHNPPPLILDILEHAFVGLNPGGVAFFQVPVYSIDYEFRIEPYLRKTVAAKSMEGHFVPQLEVFRLAQRCGLSILEVRQDHCLGMPETAISNTFLMQKV